MSDEPEGSAAEDDDLSIPDDEVLFRRLSYDGGEWVTRDAVSRAIVRPQSGGFEHDTDGVSVFRRSVLEGAKPPMGPEAVALRPGDIVVGFTVRDVRSLALSMKNDPWPKDVPDPDHPRYVAHALIVGLDALGTSAQVRTRKKLAKSPSMEFVLGG